MTSKSKNRHISQPSSHPINSISSVIALRSCSPLALTISPLPPAGFVIAFRWNLDDQIESPADSVILAGEQDCYHCCHRNNQLANSEGCPWWLKRQFVWMKVCTWRKKKLQYQWRFGHGEMFDEVSLYTAMVLWVPVETVGYLGRRKLPFSMPSNIIS